MKEIPLSKGFVALVDDEDYEFLSQWKWHVNIRGTNKYAQSRKYIRGVGNDKMVKMHRLVMKPKNGEDVDHINGNSLDNRKQNLRLCSRGQNVSNKRKGNYPLTTSKDV